MEIRLLAALNTLLTSGNGFDYYCKREIFMSMFTRFYVSWPEVVCTGTLHCRKYVERLNVPKTQTVGSNLF